MKGSLLFFFLGCSILFISCGGNSGERPGKGIRFDEFQPGEVAEKVVCRNDQAVSYSLYLPSGYSPGRTYPVMLAFDPHALGNLPVEKYMNLAEKYGYILMGSNDSKNGLKLNETQSIIGPLLDDLRNRYSTDTNRICLLGFSGGSRVAAMVALYGGGIRGVIGCGAGFPGAGEPARYRFDYIGLAGNEDFNMNELVSLDEQLDRANFRHALLIFEGKHDWPPVEIMDHAFTWNQFCGMKDGLIPKNDSLVARFAESLRKREADAEKRGDILQQYEELKQGFRFLDGLAPAGDLKSRMTAVKNSAEYRKAAREMERVRKTEIEQQRMFAENFYLRDLSWWRETIKDFGLRITNGKNPQEVLMYKRIMSYLSLLAYMQYAGADSAGNREKAGFALEVYRIVDPENASKIK